MMQPIPKFSPCPCGSGRAFHECCGLFLSGERLPAQAEQLMRSRYCAYVQEDAAYLLATWHPATRPEVLNFAEEDKPKWLGLTVKRRTAFDDNHAIVEFVARYKINGRGFRMHETSRFERIEGRWYYRDGVLA